MPLTQYHQSKIALGSDTTLVIVTDQPVAKVDRIFVELWLTIYKFEQQFSRFIFSSELTRFNQQAGLQVPISHEFYKILLAAQRLAIKTNGLYNPFILPALQKAGYLNSAVDNYTNDPAPDYRDRSVTSINKLSLSPEKASIPYGTALDLGGCGKGYLADLLAKLPITKKLHGYWFSLGGDVVGKGTDALEQPWKIHIQNAQQPNKRLPQTLTGSVDGFAIATSGTIIHGSQTSKNKWHHLIDTDTSQPAKTDILLCTVMHRHATDADVLASCAVILGKKHAEAFLRKHGAYNAVIQTSQPNDKVIKLDIFKPKKLQEILI